MTTSSPRSESFEEYFLENNICMIRFLLTLKTLKSTLVSLGMKIFTHTDLPSLICISVAYSNSDSISPGNFPISTVDIPFDLL
jgi:hypothetical protein